jgi:hypothetical protein
MAIAFRGVAAIASGGATDPLSAPSLPASTANGDIVLLFVIVKYGSGAGGVTINTPTDWTLLNNGEAANSGLTNSGNDAGNVRAAIFWRIKDAGWSTMPAVDLSGTPNATMRGAISYSLGGGETWGTPEGATAVDDSVGSTGIDPAASGTTLAFASGDWFGSFAAVNGDAGTLGTHTATVSGVTFGTQNNRLDGTTSSGTDLRGHVVDKSYSSGTASAGPDGALSLTTGSASGAGVMVFYKLALAGGDADASPAVIATTVTAPAATVTADAEITPATITATVAVPAATPLEEASASPAVIAVTAALGAPAVYFHDYGPFTVDFSGYGDGGIPTETGLRDAFLDIPSSQDEMGIRSGEAAVVDFRGPDQDFTDGGGRRGLLWRNTVTLTDDVSGVIDPDDATPEGFVGAGAALHIDLADQYLGVGCWFLGSPFGWAELGLIGNEQEDFHYLDLMPGIPVPTTGDEVRLRSVDGWVAVEVNGETVLGPCEIPAGLLASPVHGLQMDVSEDTHEALGMAAGVTVESDSTPLTERPAPGVLAVGTAVETASSTTINVPYPSGIAAGELLVCIIGTRNGGTTSASGWSDVPSGFGLAVSTGARALTKIATGSESGSLTVTKSTAGIMAGVMLRVDAAFSWGLDGHGNGSASTSLPSLAATVLGPNRTALWVAVTTIDTDITMPTDFFPMSVGVSGAQAIRLGVGAAVLDAHGDFPAPPYNAYTSAGNFPVQTGTAAASTTSAVGLLILTPALVEAASADASPAVIATTVSVPAATVTADLEVSPATIAATVGLPAVTVTAGADVTPAPIAAAVSLPAATVDASADVTPAAIVSTVSVPAVSVTASADVTPAVIAASVSFPSPTVTADADVTPAVIATVVALPTASATDSGAGDASTSPAAVATVTTLPAVTVTATADVTPAPVSNVVAFPAATVTAGVDATPATIAAAVSFPTPTVTASADVTPATIATVTALPSATVTADVSVTPAPVALVTTLPAATVTAGADVTPETIATVVSFPTPTVTGGGAGGSDLHAGASEADAIYFGSAPATAVYAGTVRVFPAA